MCWYLAGLMWNAMFCSQELYIYCRTLQIIGKYVPPRGRVMPELVAFKTKR